MILKHATRKIRPAIFFDRDGVLNIDKKYLYKKDDFEWIDGAKDTIKHAQTEGFLTIVVTNQSGIARGYYTVDEMHQLHDWMQQELVTLNTRIDAFYYCPFNDSGVISKYVFANHPDRKPNPGMITRAVRDFNIDLSGSLLIGDKHTDIEAADRLGLQSILFTGGNLHEIFIKWLDHSQ